MIGVILVVGSVSLSIALGVVLAKGFLSLALHLIPTLDRLDPSGR